ncbi:tol-pal system-associated acyl-CoA thioesterase [Acidomonas methanolica]|uniref:tol-pal system-associated acyl-CoA thioesterase n=1 Tax=Acidomonas methanolica TaxID=437 RepID=UPI00211AA32D|nr:tol-pal system-associated acyl-CoA thioesterase [Acidomonas methanolica]MCQ9154333.1 tol-pal system-associated acyl-CoA thioesterase [Acidomonas methanolica]
MGTHRIVFRVYYEDTDAGGVVYHARYLAFAERARTEAIRSVGASVVDLARDEGLAFVVRQADIRYLAPVRLDDEIEIETSLVDMSPIRLRLAQQFRNITRGNVVCTTIAIELTSIAIDSMKPAAIPPQWRDLVTKLACRAA